MNTIARTGAVIRATDAIYRQWKSSAIESYPALLMCPSMNRNLTPPLWQQAKCGAKYYFQQVIN
jgi:hypothetical protein